MTTTAIADSSRPVANRPFAVSTWALMIIPVSAAVAPTTANTTHRIRFDRTPARVAAPWLLPTASTWRPKPR